MTNTIADGLREILVSIRTSADTLEALLSDPEQLPGLQLARLVVDLDALAARLQRGLADLGASQ